MAGHVSASAQRGVERRARILDAALELFAEQGFILTSLPMIAERVGITHAGILHHFGSIGGVLGALLEREGPVPHLNAETVGVTVSLLEKKTSARSLLAVQPCHTDRNEEN